MSPKVQYFITADYATTDINTKKLSVSGFFDTFRNFVFPSESPTFYIIIGLRNLNKSTKIIIPIFAPDGTELLKAEVEITSISPNETTNVVVPLKIPLPQKGKYIVKVLADQEQNELDEFFFSADYPEKRVFNKDEIESILRDPTLAKNAKIKIQCAKCQKEFVLELHLDPNKEISEGAMPFPENDTIKCCGNDIDLTGVRRQIEWGFGTKLPN